MGLNFIFYERINISISDEFELLSLKSFDVSISYGNIESSRLPLSNHSKPKMIANIIKYVTNGESILVFLIECIAEQLL